MMLRSDGRQSMGQGRAQRSALAQIFHAGPRTRSDSARSEEHTSELQSQSNIVCRLLLEKKKISHLGFLASQHGPLITISTTPFIAGDSCQMYAIGALLLSPCLRSLSICCAVVMLTIVIT